MSTRLIIDCDPGHDDAMAILLAARELDLVGITTVFGNSSLENTTRNALAICTLAKLDIPVAMGMGEALVAKRASAADIHGKSGLDGATLPEPDREPVAKHAVQFIIDAARAAPGQLVLAPIGPLTNIAVALKTEPRLAGWLKCITLMGGSTTIGNISSHAEFNIYCDPEAAAVVFASGVPIMMAGLNVTRQAGIGDAHIDRLRQSGARVSTIFADLLGFYLKRSQEIFRLQTASMHDPCAILPLWDMDETLKEVKRISDLGVHGITFPDNPVRLGLPSIHNEYWEPLWKALVDHDILINCHIGSGESAPHASDESPISAWITTMPISIVNATADWLYTPMWKKHPDLRIALTGHAHHKRAQRLGEHVHFGNLQLHVLVVLEVTRLRTVGARMRHRHLQRVITNAHGIGREFKVAKGAMARLVSAVDFTHHVGVRHARILKYQFGVLVEAPAALVEDLANAQPGRVDRNQKLGAALADADIRIGARIDEKQLRHRTVGDETFLAV